MSTINIISLSKHFTRNEFACNCGCGSNTVDYALLVILEKVREHFGKPVTVNSGHRCAKYNALVGGAKNSQHVLGRAADIVVLGVSPQEVVKYLLETYPDQYGIGRYETFTHVDTRDWRARW